MRLILLAAATVALLSASGNCDEALDAEAATFLSSYSDAAEAQYFKSVTASWNYNTNLTTANAEILNAQSLHDANFSYTWGNMAKDQFGGRLDDLQESDYRQIQGIQVLGTANLDEAEQKEYNNITTRMDQVYSTAEVTLSDGDTYDLGELSDILVTSRDYYRLKEVWQGWYENSGRPIKQDYADFVELSNKAYGMDGYEDTGAYWRSWYETENFEEVLETLWQELKPMYEELHAYVRRKLYEHYGPDFINLKGPIPAHLFGNMWAQTWGNVYDLMEPYSGKSSVDATPNMLDQGYDYMQMFKVSEEFFTSVGLEAMTDEFWANSMLVQPPDGRPVVCHASAWNFYNGDDFRVKQCTKVNMEDLITVHHEMGHIQYYQQYKEQPVPFRSGANPGFHEAVGDTLSLSVSTPKHLFDIGLLDSVDEDDDADINYLLKQALEKIAFLPFGYMIDKWRWAVMDGSTPIERYQSTWDELRLKYQGIVPPVERTDADDFDPGAKYHIPGNTPYIRYFVSFVIQFQFYESMCNEANHEGPLYKCDFYKSTDAGTKLAEMLKLGSSEKWPVAMQKLTGSPEMTTAALQKYFEPLTVWLKNQNQLNGDVPGWTEEWRPKGFYPASRASDFVSTQNAEAETVYNAAVHAEWNYNTNINPQTEDAARVEGNKQATFYANQGIEAKKYDAAEITDDPETARLITKMSDLGTGALPAESLSELSQINIALQSGYSQATVNGKPLDPDLTATIATSRNYNDLRDTWKGWRDAVANGGATRTNFERYVELQNEAAVLNNYDDMGAYWRSAYETPGFDQQLEEVWQEVLPLYEQLHSYVRRKLYQKYGEVVINLNGPIPAHLLGNMWAQDWANIYDLVEPFPGKVRPDATQGMIDKGWDAKKMFEVADDFFTNMGLEGVSQMFWDESMLTKPTDGREVVCHASAWDFYDKTDFRVKMCTTVDQIDFITIHHELGHIQYFLQYKDLHVMFRDGANPGFHEAVGDVLALSVSTLEHMHKLGLIAEPADDSQTNINYLMSQALDKISFLPFGYLIDKWRWDVFSGRTAPQNLNQGWWDYRLKYQGVTPPVARTENDFDAAAKFHVSNNVPYIRYFVSFIVQFQFYEALCKEANHTGPLYKCDFDGNLAAGKKLGDMLKLGSSVTWEEAMRQVVGTTQMSSRPLLNYFDELYQFLKIENEKFGDELGWSDYSWQPPENTQVLENERVVLIDGNGGSHMTSSSVIMTSFACVVMALLKFITE